MGAACPGWGHSTPSGDISVRPGTFDVVGDRDPVPGRAGCPSESSPARTRCGSCPRARRVSGQVIINVSDFSILSPGAQGVPLRSGAHPAAWNVPGRSGSVGSGGVSTVDGVVELLRRSLSVQWTAGRFSDSACLCFRLPSSGPGTRVRPRSGCDTLGLSEGGHDCISARSTRQYP